MRFEKLTKKIFWWWKKLTIGFQGLWLVGPTLAHGYISSCKSRLK